MKCFWPLTVISAHSYIKGHLLTSVTYGKLCLKITAKYVIIYTSNKKLSVWWQLNVDITFTFCGSSLLFVEMSYTIVKQMFGVCKPSYRWWPTQLFEQMHCKLISAIHRRQTFANRCYAFNDHHNNHPLAGFRV